MVPQKMEKLTNLHESVALESRSSSPALAANAPKACNMLLNSSSCGVCFFINY